MALCIMIGRGLGLGLRFVVAELGSSYRALSLWERTLQRLQRRVAFEYTKNPETYC